MSVRTAAAPRQVRLPRPRPRLLVALALLLAALAGGWLWLRDSSLVEVRDVTISGAQGYGAERVRSSLETAARDMTTLNVDEEALLAAVAPYPLVKDVVAQADPPHGLRIRVIERVPVGVLTAPSGRVVVADDGTLLRRVPAEGLPEIAVRSTPGGDRVRERKTEAKVDLLAAAPSSMRGRIVRVTLGSYGLTARLDSGPVLRFGDGRRLRAKWIAARRVMTEPGAAKATYIDVRVPERPAAGGLPEWEGGAPASAVASSIDPDAIASEDPGVAPVPDNPADGAPADPAADGTTVGPQAGEPVAPVTGEAAPADPSAEVAPAP